MDFSKLSGKKSEEYIELCRSKGINSDMAESILGLLKERTKLQQKVDALRSQKKEAAKKRDSEFGKKIKEELKVEEVKLKEVSHEVDMQLSQLPNLPMSDVPLGGEENNKILDTVGKKPSLINPKDHIKLGVEADVLDIERATKTSGSGFYFLKNQAVELEFALIRWVFELLKKKGFKLMIPPVMMNEKVMGAGGYLGSNADEVYKTQDNLYLVGTSEQSMLGYHMDEIIKAPKRYVAFSTCFRREAGSYGKDVKGIIRTHQFDKVEMFSYVKPEDSEKEHEMLVKIQEEILQKLKIPYQKVLLATGDMSVCSAKTIDLESWLPSQNRYKETHSCSNCTDWQSRKAKIRYAKGKYVHTLNGTAMAIGRLMVALWENHQDESGNIIVPEVLHKYTDKLTAFGPDYSKFENLGK